MSPYAAAILRANEAFYRYFSIGDYTSMARLWAKRAPVTCLHPGLPTLIGRESVLESWQEIIAQNAPLSLVCHHARVEVYGECAVVTCYEGNGEQPAHLAATNVFVREDDEWKMVHHQAGPLAGAISPPMKQSGLN
jgi:hypothetical protein